VIEDTPDGPRLRGGRCGACARHHFPVGAECPWCGSGDVTEVLLSDRGRLWAWTAVTAPPPGYDGDVPYGFGVVELPEGLRVITRLAESDPAKLHEGDELRLSTITIGETTAWEFGP
jgi:uncharacterized protein